MSGARGGIFISYRREDTAFAAGRLSDRVVDRFPSASVFMDVETIEPGADFSASIEHAVSSCNVLIAMIGKKWLEIEDGYGGRRIDNPHDFVALEIIVALQRNIPVIPVLVDNMAMPSVGDLPQKLAGLARRNAVRLGHETFRSDIERILPAIDRAIQGSPRVRSEGADSPSSPPTQQAAATHQMRPVGQAPAQRPGPAHDSAPANPPGADHRPPMHYRPPAGNRPPPSSPPRSPGSVERAGPFPFTGPSPHFPPTGAGTGRMPAARTALRISLWWLLFFFVYWTCVGLVAKPLSVVILAPLTGLLIFLLSREIRAERAILDRAGVDQNDIRRRPLSSRHIRRVVLWCSAVTVVLVILGLAS